jgi:hypothetical protein
MGASEEIESGRSMEPAVHLDKALGFSLNSAHCAGKKYQ